eukprot:5629805-Lingulodinium_polyedra.AAC.1
MKHHPNNIQATSKQHSSGIRAHSNTCNDPKHGRQTARVRARASRAFAFRGRAKTWYSHGARERA